MPGYNGTMLFPIITLLLLRASTSSSTIDSFSARRSPSEKSACDALRQNYSNLTVFSGSAIYDYETQTQYWSATNFNHPECVFVPQNSEQVAFAVTIMTATSSKFSVRGGGHMPIPEYNGIDDRDGVLISTSNLTTLELSRDESVVSVGAGNRWRDVYSYLAPSGLAAVGGRVGGVGVSGYMLGGVISFYSNQYGFGADNAVKYECILANGSVIEATATNEHSDLFWALKGGGNSFCIVTRFDMKTVKSPQVHVGIAQYSQSQGPAYLDAVYNFGKYGALDAKAAIIPTIIAYPTANMTVYAASRFYDSVTTGDPVAFENFTSPNLEPVADSYALQPLATYIAATDALQPTGLRQAFRVLSSMVSREAVELIHNNFIKMVNTELSDVANVQASFTFQPVTKEFIQQGIIIGGNPQGIDVSKAPYFWVVENWTWTNASDDDAVNANADRVTAEINKLLEAQSLQAEYLYLNDAGKNQPIFQSYPAANLRRLQAIRQKYDPNGIYIDLMPGGWKVDNA